MNLKNKLTNIKRKNKIIKKWKKIISKLNNNLMRSKLKNKLEIKNYSKNILSQNKINNN